MVRKMQSVWASAALALFVVGCIDSPTVDDRSDAALIGAEAYDIETLATGLDAPWGIAFIDENRFLVTELSGQLRLVENGVVSEPISGVPSVYFAGQGGLLDIVLAPDFETTGTLLLSYAKGDDAQNATAVSRARLAGQSLVDLEEIFVSAPWRDTSSHFGGRMVILPDETLMLTLGDAFAYREEAQRRTNHLGTVVRMNLDGSVPTDNPFANEDGPAAWVYSYGHRNVQGIAYDGARQLIWENEHGPQGGDEVNILQAGANYGWPIATEGRDYNGARISPFSSHDGFEAPVYGWAEYSIAPAGMMVYDADLFEAWRGDLFIAGLASRALHRIDLNEDGAVIEEYRLLREIDQRIRQVAQGPDGAIYVLVDGPEGSVERLTPAQ